MRYILILIVLVASCTHKRNGQYIRTEDGKIYKLEEAVPNEAYIFKEVDTVAINKLKSNHP